MGIVDTLAAAVTGASSTNSASGENDADSAEPAEPAARTQGTDRVVAYRCVECETEFDRRSTRMVGLRCPDCGSADLRAQARE